MKTNKRKQINKILKTKDLGKKGPKTKPRHKETTTDEVIKKFGRPPRK